MSAPTALLKWSNNEDEFIRDILKDKQLTLDTVIPDEMDIREVLSGIKACVSVVGKLDRARDMVGPLLGRFMALVVKRPEIYEKAGFDSANDFEKAEILDKIGHSSLWEYKRIYEVLPALPMDQYVVVGKGKLLDIAKVCKTTHATEGQTKELLDKAVEPKMTREKFRTFLEGESGLASRGDLSGATYPLNGSAAQVTELREFLADARFVAFAESDQPITMLLRAIHESSTEWPLLDEEPGKEGW